MVSGISFLLGFLLGAGAIVLADKVSRKHGHFGRYIAIFLPIALILAGGAGVGISLLLNP
jgi:hypothetical protein